MAEEQEQTQQEDFGEWMVVEIMGHQRVAGWVTEEWRFGTKLMRVDVPATANEAARTQRYTGQAIFCLHTVTEEVARRAAERFSDYQPSHAYQPPQLASETRVERAPHFHELDDDDGCPI